jgi:hypothetical protein
MTQWFERLGQYVDQSPVPKEFLAHPKLSLIRLHGKKTQQGWNSKEFMKNQELGAFEPTRAIRFFEKYSQPFAFVMRSVPFIVVDIDGKNGGIETANALHLPVSRAEPSKGENGFHVVYEVPYTKWDPQFGYNEFPDIIGLIPGVDIKGTGAVYHHKNQQWNEERIAILPDSLSQLMGRARDIRRAARIAREGTVDMDPEDLLILHDQLLDKLKKPIRIGGRNQTLYAIGCRMLVSGYPAWDRAIFERGSDLGLNETELYELIRNIETYA